jgi:hypothetical protein
MGSSVAHKFFVSSRAETEPVVRDRDGDGVRATAEIDGTPTGYRIDVVDNGEPGRDDVFRIQTALGYTAGGDHRARQHPSALIGLRATQASRAVATKGAGGRLAEQLTGAVADHQGPASAR